MVLADTLSHAYGSSSSPGETEQDGEAVHMIQYLSVSEETQTAIQNATESDYHSEQPKEPMICHELPTRSWKKVAVDIFELDQREFLVTVDYYSSFFEVDR